MHKRPFPYNCQTVSHPLQTAVQYPQERCLKPPGIGTLTNYTAPALQKGLDILEHLATSATPLSTAQLAEQLGRTVSQLYRMILVLGERGYVEMQDNGFVVTPKAFCLALDGPEVRSLLAAAAPEMERLARLTRRTCYLSAADNKTVVVIAVQPSLGAFGLDMRIGTRQPLIDTAAGQVHFGFQRRTSKDKWLNRLIATEDRTRLAQFVKSANRAALSGQAERRHRHMDCLTEISSPVTTPADRVFALSLLYLHHPGNDDLTTCRAELSQSAGKITQTLRGQHASPDRHSRDAQPVEAAAHSDNGRSAYPFMA